MSTVPAYYYDTNNFARVVYDLSTGAFKQASSFYRVDGLYTFYPNEPPAPTSIRGRYFVADMYNLEDNHVNSEENSYYYSTGLKVVTPEEIDAEKATLYIGQERFIASKGKLDSNFFYPKELGHGQSLEDVVDPDTVTDMLALPSSPGRGGISNSFGVLSGYTPDRIITHTLDLDPDFYYETNMWYVIK